MTLLNVLFPIESYNLISKFPFMMINTIGPEINDRQTCIVTRPRENVDKKL